MRLFVSIPLPAAQRTDLSGVLAGVRTTRPDQWHLTLAFLADHRDPDGLADALARAVASHAPLALRLEGGGSFGGVVWAGVGGDLERLADLAADVRAACGSAADPKPFRAHVTVARRSDPGRLRDYRGPAWDVESIDVVHSDLREHTVLHRLPLG
jgi:2'-5' RNA ligase